MNEWTLLAVVDSPTINSGFAKVGQNLLRRWKPFFKRIDVWAINYSGYPGPPGRIHESEWSKPPFTLYPASPHPEKPWHSAVRHQALLNHLSIGNYSHFWMIQDHFLVAQHGFPDALAEGCNKLGVKSYYYIPVDAAMERSWAKAVECVDFPVAYTQWGRSEIMRHTGQFCREIDVLPHGVDTSVYRPAENWKEVREKRGGGWAKPDDIVLINVNANQRRKDTIRSLELLMVLRQKDPRFKLIMHMSRDMPQSDGIDLDTAAKQLRLTEGEEWICTDNGKNFRGITGTFTEDELNVLYNTADIYLTTTLGEGWGLGITEALAAGLVVAAPAHTACQEISDGIEGRGMKDRFIRLPTELGSVCLNWDNSRLRNRVDLYQAATRILNYVQAKEHVFRKDVREGLSDHVRNWLSWDRIADKWVEKFKAAKPTRESQLRNIISRNDGNPFSVVMISCPEREKIRQETLLKFSQTDWPDSNVNVMMNGGEHERKEERQHHNALSALKFGVSTGKPWILFLEDDLEFNEHLFHNLTNWICLRDLTLASLYNPNIQELHRDDAAHYFEADPNACYGSQAYLLSHECADFLVNHWFAPGLIGMQDIRATRLAAKLGKPIYYFTPSLVQHVGAKSTFGGRFHQTQDFDPKFKL